MKILYVTASCLNRNTSANMSHNGYVQGLLEHGHDVDILMAKDSWGQEDAALPTWEQATYFSYPSVAVQDRIREKVRAFFPTPAPAASAEGACSEQAAQAPGKSGLKAGVRALAKQMFYLCFPSDPLYPLERTWLKKAAKFSSRAEYDLVITNSTPAASHKLAGSLIEKGKLKCKRWVQIWEDPWYFDLYGGRSEEVRKEEHALLRSASEVYYVSPLTLKYQKQFYPDCAHKMKHIPLPYFDFSGSEGSGGGELSFGYFGDYYAQTRNLKPFYDALKKSGMQGYIYGDNDLNLPALERVVVSGRVTLDVLAQVQEKTDVLVHLSNLKGGQIPGKIYHYSATSKPILFILDGTREEQDILRAYFGKFHRFYFCENKTEEILSAMEAIRSDIASGKTWSPLAEFSPKEVVATLF